VCDLLSDVNNYAMLDPQRSDTALRNIDSYPVFRRAFKSHLFIYLFIFPHN